MKANDDRTYSWPFGDDADDDCAERQVVIALALNLDRTRQRRRKSAGRWRRAKSKD